MKYELNFVARGSGNTVVTKDSRALLFLPVWMLSACDETKDQTFRHPVDALISTNVRVMRKTLGSAYDLTPLGND